MKLFENRRFTIGRKLWIGFGSIAIFILLSYSLTYITLNKNLKINDEILNISNPSAKYIIQLEDLIVESQMLIKNWVFIDQQEQTIDKLKLNESIDVLYPKIKSDLINISKFWTPEQNEKLEIIFLSVEDSLFNKYSYVMKSLSSFSDYEDPMIIFEVQPMVETGGEIMFIAENTIGKTQKLRKEIKGIADSKSENMQLSFLFFKRVLLISGIVLIFITLLISIFTIKAIVNPINYIKDITLKMSKGFLPKEQIKAKNDEIGDMANAFNYHINSLRQKASFSNEIGDGNFLSDFKALSDDDILGKSLINMKNSLQKSKKEEENRKIEDKTRNWATQGLAIFGDLLRQDNEDMEKLSFKIISKLVNYLDANQGGLFVLNDDNSELYDNKDNSLKYYQVEATYAYGREKFNEEKINWGEGLVGRCGLEKKSIYITDMPEGYISITSGLGNAQPNALLLVPLILKDEIFGVIEIASFTKFEAYQIEFVEKIGESIASTISGAKINKRTSELLKNSQQQSEEMKTQEEEMRQNLEELQATQEDMRKSQESENDELKKLNIALQDKEDAIAKLKSQLASS